MNELKRDVEALKHELNNAQGSELSLTDRLVMLENRLDELETDLTDGLEELKEELTEYYKRKLKKKFKRYYRKHKLQKF